MQATRTLPPSTVTLAQKTLQPRALPSCSFPRSNRQNNAQQLTRAQSHASQEARRQKPGQAEGAKSPARAAKKPAAKSPRSPQPSRRRPRAKSPAKPRAKSPAPKPRINNTADDHHARAMADDLAAIRAAYAKEQGLPPPKSYQIWTVLNVLAWIGWSAVLASAAYNEKLVLILELACCAGGLEDD